MRFPRASTWPASRAPWTRCRRRPAPHRAPPAPALQVAGQPVLGGRGRARGTARERAHALAALHQALVLKLPVGLHHGVRVDGHLRHHLLDRGQLVADVQDSHPDGLLHLLRESTGARPPPGRYPAATAASTAAPAASRRSSLPHSDTSCRLAGRSPRAGTGSASAGTPARLTGSVYRASSSSSALASFGGKIASVGVTSRSKRANRAVRWAGQCAPTPAAAVTASGVTCRPASRRRATSAESRPAAWSKTSRLDR